MSGWYTRGSCCLVRLEKWTDRSLLKFSKGKCKFLHLCTSSSMHGTCWGPRSWKAAWQNRTGGSWQTQNLTWASSVPLQVKKVNDILGCLGRNVASRLRGDFCAYNLRQFLIMRKLLWWIPFLKVLLVFLYCTSRV